MMPAHVHVYMQTHYDMYMYIYMYTLHVVSCRAYSCSGANLSSYEQEQTVGQWMRNPSKLKPACIHMHHTLQTHVNTVDLTL